MEIIRSGQRVAFWWLQCN